MNKTFIETNEFTQWVKEYLSDDAFADLQRELLNDPERARSCGAAAAFGKCGRPTRDEGRENGEGSG